MNGRNTLEKLLDVYTYMYKLQKEDRNRVSQLVDALESSNTMILSTADAEFILAKHKEILDGLNRGA